MAKKCKFSFYSQSDKECVYTPSIGSDFCIWHDPEIRKDQEFVPLRLKSAIKETGGDLEGFLLRKADLSGLNLRDVDLRDADLREANLEGTDCRGADFRGAKLNRVAASSGNFEGANFMAANLSDGVFYNASFKDCNMRITNMGRSDIRGADFSGSDLRNTDFSETFQDEKTNFYNVTGITAKIIKGEEGVPEKPSGGPPTTPMGPPGTQLPAEGENLSGQAEEEEPFSDIFDSVEDEIGKGPDPLTTKKENEAPAVQAEGALSAEETGPTSITSVSADDETDFGIKLDGSSPLTKKHPLQSSKVKKLIIAVILLAAGLGTGLFVESEYGLLGKFTGDDGPGGSPSQLKKTINSLSDEVKEEQRKLNAVQGKLAALKKQDAAQKRAIAEKDAAIQKLISEAKGNTGSISSETLNLLEQKNRKLEDKMKHWREKCESVTSDAKKKDKKIIRMAVEATKFENRINEITNTNKRLVQKQNELEQQLKEGKVLLSEYKNRLKKAEDSYKELLQKVSKVQDPFIEEHPLSFRIDWGEYVLTAPSKEKYLTGIKFSRDTDSGFIHIDLMIVGKTPRSKPNFRINLFGQGGNQLARKMKIDFSKTGLKYQEVKLMSRGWRHTEEEPVYFQVKFTNSE